jgi:transcriptional regulator with XRE-family HTH domain
MSKLNNKPMCERVATRIRSARLERGISQQEFGDRLGVTYQQVSKYETATTSVTVPRLAQIAQTLNLPVSFFLDEAKLADDAPFAGSDHGRLALLQSYEKLEGRNRYLLIAIAHSMVEVAGERSMAAAWGKGVRMWGYENLIGWLLGVASIAYAITVDRRARRRLDFAHAGLVSLKPAIQGDNREEVLAAINDLLAKLGR